MSILQYSGGSVMAMAGKECLVIISDNRLGEQLKTISMEVPKLHMINDSVVVGLTGLRSDQQTFANKLRFRMEMYRLREEREITGKAFASLVAAMLYEARFGPWFIEPVIGSVDKKTGDVYLCAMDLIGAPCEPEDYVCAGTCAESLHGMCESLWRPGLGPEELFEVAAQSMLSACDRDSLSGYGAVAMVITRDKVVTRLIKGRKD
ncbi:proteasome beta 3 subunit [Strigomonas culicis]|uniref:Proteasome subunit beta n=3 Tax=Strigomonas culicis TaxID=28005 RepID=S9UE00_9TRYP|nr:20S proteasome subunit beta 3 [Strigomonas culicis]EPY35678.1 proteasome beta 3 subunit [Strigomonas culicis]EPY37293.1 proteasome beta 3 subunit [Strigomonas culicis]|eukprot:EPY26964.1 20S proteasome subunit beta 3 [Strigomonas culicis]